MFGEDVARDLNRKSFLEAENTRLKDEEAELERWLEKEGKANTNREISIEAAAYQAGKKQAVKTRGFIAYAEEYERAEKAEAQLKALEPVVEALEKWEEKFGSRATEFGLAIELKKALKAYKDTQETKTGGDVDTSNKKS